MQRLRTLKNNRWINKTYKTPLTKLEEQINLFSGKDVIAICPTPTGNSWEGVFIATKGLFENNLFSLPQYYSNPLYNEKELDKIAEFIKNAGVKEVIFSGYLPYFDRIICQLKNFGISVGIIYHGSHVTVHEDERAAEYFYKLADLSKNKKVDKIGFVKKGLDKSFNKLTGVNCYPILLKTDENIFKIKSEKKEGVNIGVLTHDAFRKNIYNQTSAALMVDNAIVHMKSPYKTFYLGNNERIKIHSYIESREAFLKLLGSMQVNLYVTYSECWGQFVNESLAMGTPCLTSDVSAVLDFDDELKRKLIVKEHDNDFAIYEKILEVLSDLDWFTERGKKYVLKLNELSKEKLNIFLNA